MDWEGLGCCTGGPARALWARVPLGVQPLVRLGASSEEMQLAPSPPSRLLAGVLVPLLRGQIPPGGGTATQAVLAGSFAGKLRNISGGVMDFFPNCFHCFRVSFFPTAPRLHPGVEGRDVPCAHLREQHGAAVPMLLLARQRVLLFGASAWPLAHPCPVAFWEGASASAGGQWRVAAAGPRGAGVP